MKKTVKGAIAAAAAAVLLVGGAGSLAYWNSSANVDGGSVNSGHLKLLTDDTNPGCSAWTLDGGDPFDPDASLLVPGDTVTESCTFTLDAEGDHMEGTVAAAPADVTGDLAEALDVTVSGITLDGTEATTFTEANDGQTLGVDVAVTFRSTSGNATMDQSAALDTITVTATQNHP